MGEKITSKVIGELEQDDEFDDWWKSKEIEIPFLDNKKLSVRFTEFEPEEDAAFIDEADAALACFLKLTTEDRNAVSEMAYQNCMDFLEKFEEDEDDDPLREMKDKNDIWDYIDPQKISVSRRHKNDKDIYVQILCECDWEQEHGLQFVFRQGKKLTRISEQDGHLTEADAWDKPDNEDELLSQF